MEWIDADGGIDVVMLRIAGQYLFDVSCALSVVNQSMLGLADFISDRAERDLERLITPRADARVEGRRYRQ
jgi:hypothetical protein